MVLVSGATKTVMRYAGDPRVGRLATPRSWDAAQTYSGWVWAADNGAFAGFDKEAYERMLGAMRLMPGCLWVTAPDVVADHDATIQLFRTWHPRLHELGWRVAFVAQDGCTVQTAPWCDMEALFIGGSTQFKLYGSIPLIRGAKRRGLWVHVGRVNTLRRIRWAQQLGVDSIDGTAFSRFANTYLPRALHFMRGMDDQQRLNFEMDLDAAACEVKQEHTC
jgi:hypothetical protein